MSSSPWPPPRSWWPPSSSRWPCSCATVARDRALTDAELDRRALAPVLALDARPTAGRRPRATDARADGRFDVILPGRHPGRRRCRARRRRGAGWPASRGAAFSGAGEGRHRGLVPVALEPEQAVVVRVLVPTPRSPMGCRLGLGGARRSSPSPGGVGGVATDRLARSVIRPAADLAARRRAAGRRATSRAGDLAGPPEIAEVAEAINLLGRPHRRAARRRARAGGRPVPPAPHAAHRTAPRRRGATAPPPWWTTSTPRSGGERPDPQARRPLHEEVAVRTATWPGRRRSGRLLGCAGRRRRPHVDLRRRATPAPTRAR